MTINQDVENVLSLLNYPFDSSGLIRKKRAIKRLFDNKSDLVPKKIAVLGGFTTANIKDMLELFLLNNGIRPEFYESDFNLFFEEALFSSPNLDTFKPDFVYLCTAHHNIRYQPKFMETKESTDLLIEQEIDSWKSIWLALKKRFNCIVIQNNFDSPPNRSLGNLDTALNFGLLNFIQNLNVQLANAVHTSSGVHLVDINYISSQVGYDRWHDRSAWYSYKSALGYDAIPTLSHSVARVISSALGKSKKCLVLDLDNTLWGGVIGDDGLSGIELGPESPVGAAHLDFQRYALSLKKRGILLAVCSKNEEETARQGFTHPNSVLKATDFSSFKANWRTKVENISAISSELNLGLDSFVFMDDNPAEREIVRKNLPQVSVPEIGDDPSRYIEFLDREGFFEPNSISREDLERSEYYLVESMRTREKEHFVDYDEFLRSLQMKAQIKSFTQGDLERITQLTNKTNQFNLTTRRYTSSEIKALCDNQRHLTLIGSLQDKFGDSGLISLIAGTIDGTTLNIDLWLMSCRVIRRGMEYAMFQELIRQCENLKLTSVLGYYRKTSKNAMVEGHYQELGFQPQKGIDGWDSVWRFQVSNLKNIPHHQIEVNCESR